MDYRFKIDFGSGFVDVAPPINHSALALELIWASLTPSATLLSINFEWVNDTARKIYDYRRAGLTGGYGIYEGLPLRIYACDDHDLAGVDLVLDLVNRQALWSCDRVVCPIMERGRIDWLKDVAATFTFSYLASNASKQTAASAAFTPISFADYKRTPYAISEIPEYTRVASLGISIFLVAMNMAERLAILNEHTQQLAGDVNNALNVGFTASSLGGTIVTLIFDALQILIDLLFLYALLNLLIKMLKDLFDAIIQAKKYKLCMREEDLFRKACEYLGLNFSSSIYHPTSEFQHATWMPRKTVGLPQANGGFFSHFDRPEDEASSLEAYGYFDGTFKEFIEVMKMKYNVPDPVIKDNTFHFEPYNTQNLTSTYVIPNTGEVGNTFNLPDPHATNAAELPPAYSIEFALDNSEMNTIHRYEGTSCSYLVQPLIVGNKKHLLHGSGVSIQLPCALGKRKDYLTKPEKMLNDIFNLMRELLPGVVSLAYGLEQGLAAGFGGIIGTTIYNGVTSGGLFLDFDTTQVPNIDTDRLGWLLLSNDSMSVPKTFIGHQVGADWRVSDANGNIMTAANLMFKFHRYNLATHGNQWLIYDKRTLPFCCSDVSRALGSNVFQLHDNRKGKFDKIEWDAATETASADYRINENFTNNLQDIITIDGIKQ